MKTELSTLFSTLSPGQKAMFLARVVHDATILARNAYVTNYEHPDGVRLRNANEFVHRVSGYIMHVLNSTEGDGQDAFVIAMIVENAKASGREDKLVDWLRNPN